MTQFEKDNPILFLAFGNLLNMKNANIEMEDDHKMPFIGMGIHLKEVCYYIRSSHIRFKLDRESMENIFPINIEGYKFEFLDFIDAEPHDWNISPEMVMFRITYQGRNVLENLAS